MVFLWNAFYFVVALGILVTIHEFGHFWVARKLGVKVLTFSVGFGKPLWQRKAKDGVNYVIAAIPLGGYVKMLDERESEVSPEEQQYAFNRVPMGLATSAGILCKVMQKILGDYLRKFVLNYMDDVLIYSPDLNTHLTHTSIRKSKSSAW